MQRRKRYLLKSNIYFLFFILIILILYNLFFSYLLKDSKIYQKKQKIKFAKNAEGKLKKNNYIQKNEKWYEQNKIYDVINFKSFENKPIIFEFLKSMDRDKKWSLEIPGILDNAQIREGTEDYTLNKYIGHFYNTAFIDGNVCLAGHNRGFEENYFENLKDIKLNNEIIYIVGNKKFKYIVSKKYIVNEYDLSCLAKNIDREITLVTCVSNEPQKRLIVKGRYIGLK